MEQKRGRLSFEVAWAVSEMSEGGATLLEITSRVNDIRLKKWLPFVMSTTVSAEIRRMRAKGSAIFRVRCERVKNEEGLVRYVYKKVG